MKRIMIAGIAAVLLLAAQAGIVSGEEVVLVFRYDVTAADAEQVISGMRAFARQNAGYVKRFSDDAITLRLPAKNIERMKTELSRIAYINNESLAREDVSAAVRELKTSIKVKEKLVSDLYAIFNTTRLSETLDVERELGSVIVDIEQLKGRLNQLNDRVQLSDVQVVINRQAIRDTGRKIPGTRWGWVRQLGISRLLSE